MTHGASRRTRYDERGMICRVRPRELTTSFTTTIMKKHVITAGVLLLAMACGQREAKQSERPQPAPAAPALAEQTPAPEADVPAEPAADEEEKGNARYYSNT